MALDANFSPLVSLPQEGELRAPSNARSYLGKQKQETVQTAQVVEMWVRDWVSTSVDASPLSECFSRN